MAQPKQQARGNGDTAGESAPSSMPPMATPKADIPDLFIDGYKNVTLHDLVIRMNLVAYYPSAQEPVAMEAHLVGRLAMSLQAFLGIYEGFGNLIKELESRGLISRKDAGSNE
jgi:hypothetical protein